MSDKAIGESIGRRYRILEILGQGGMGTVYKALDTRLQRLVALKVLSSAHSAQENQHLLREFARAGARLNHPNIVPIYEVGETEGLLYQIFEYFEGRTLSQIMADGKPLDPDYAIEIIRQVGTGLRYAHQHGVIHRDVKPSNILISNNGRVLISDFGLAIALGSPTLTQTGTIAGTPAYMSPEQVKGKRVDARSDIFSLGVVFYELLTGRKPFSGESTAKLFFNVLEEEPVSPRQINPSVPAPINEIVLRSLAKEPSQRFQTADDFLRALAGPLSSVIRQTLPGLAERESASAVPASGRPLRLRWLVALAWLLLAVFGLASIVWMSNRAPNLAPATDSPGSSLEHTLNVLAALGAVLVLWLLWRSYAARRKREQWGDIPSLTGQLLSQGSDSLVTGRTDQTQPTSLEQAVGQREVEVEDLEATQTELMPYPPPHASSAEALTHYPSAIAWLLILGGPDRGREIRLGDNVTFGRDTGNDIILHEYSDEYSGIKPQAQISLENGRFYISDWSQTGTTYVNSVRIAGGIQELHDRDEIEVGANLFLFVQAISPADLTSEAKLRLREFDEIWDQLTISARHD